jgi:hypothetical protein
MPPLLVQAKQIPFSVADENQDIEELENEGFEVVAVQDKKICIRTSSLEEKANACQLIQRYATELKAGFFEYVVPVTEMMIPMMKFFYHEDIRLAAVSIMPALLTSVKEYYIAHGQQPDFISKHLVAQFQQMFPSFIEAAKEEDDTEILHEGLEAVSQCIEIISVPSLTPEQMQQYCQLFNEIIMGIVQRRHESESKKNDENYDEEDPDAIEEETEKDDLVISAIADVLAKFAKHMPDHFFRIAGEVLQIYGELIKPQFKANDRQASICIMVEAIEKLGLPALQYFQEWFPYG